jgi:hypothetical protein
MNMIQTEKKSKENRERFCKGILQIGNQMIKKKKNILFSSSIFQRNYNVCYYTKYAIRGVCENI